MNHDERIAALRIRIKLQEHLIRWQQRRIRQLKQPRISISLHTIIRRFAPCSSNPE